MGFPRQEYWSGLPFPSLGDLPDSGVKPHLLNWQVDSYHWATQEAHTLLYLSIILFFFFFSFNASLHSLCVLEFAELGKGIDSPQHSMRGSLSWPMNPESVKVLFKYFFPFHFPSDSSVLSLQYTAWYYSQRKSCDPNSTLTAAAKSLRLCPTLWDPIDGSPPGSPVPGILQARTLEWVAISFSNAWKWKVKVKSLSRVQLFATPWTAAYQAPLSMGFFRQE